MRDNLIRLSVSRSTVTRTLEQSSPPLRADPAPLGFLGVVAVLCLGVGILCLIKA